MADKRVVVGFASANPFKLSETKRCFQQLAMMQPCEVIGLSPSKPVAETGVTFEDNAYMKLDFALTDALPPEVTHVIAEDSGLVVDVLDGLYGISPFPGVFSDRWMDNPQIQNDLLGTSCPPEALTYEQKNRAILKLMENQTNRRASYVAVLACWERRTERNFFVRGDVELAVALEPCGERGFGYDPIMIPVQYDRNRTMAQLSGKEKNSFSHRYHAISAFLQQIASPTHR